MLLAALAAAQQRTATVAVSIDEITARLDIGRMALGRGDSPKSPCGRTVSPRSAHSARA